MDQTTRQAERKTEATRPVALKRALVAVVALVIAIIAIVLIDREQSWLGARLYQCVVVFALAVVLAWATRGALRNTFVMVCSLLIGLIALEAFALVTTKTETGEPGAVADDSGLAQARPLVGWGPTKPGVFHSTKVAPDGHKIFDTNVTIDDTLNRKTVPSTGPRPIVFFGDSWIYGDGVDDDATLPQAFADLTGRKIPILNLSFAGWSPAQNLAALQSGLYKSLLDAPRHFILFTATFHLERTACKGDYAASQSPRLVPDGSTMKYVGPCAGGFSLLKPLEDIARRFALYQRVAPLFTQPSRRDVETYLKIIESFVATAKQTYDVPTTVLFAPFSDAYIKSSGYTEAQIVDALRHAGIDVLVDKLPHTDDPSLYEIPGDGHPTPLANKERAKEIEAHLEKVDPAALSGDGK